MSSIPKTQSQATHPNFDEQIQRSRLFGEDAGLWQTLRNALVITNREVRDSLRDWRIIVPIVLLTLCFPLLANIASSIFIRFFNSYGADGENLIEAFLPLMPMIVGFFPVSISLVIALETFVGEKERRSLEPLLSTPLTNTELYMGKVFAATLPPLLAAYLGISIYLGGLILGAQQWRPDPMLIVMIVVLTTVQALVMVTGAVVISSQTTSTRAANLLASVIILPMSLLVMFESVIMVQPHQRSVLWWVILGLIVVVVLLVRTGARIFNREELLGRAVDQLNIKWAFRVFTDQFRGISHEDRESYTNNDKPLPRNPTIFHWYARSVFPVFGRIRKPLFMIGLACTVAFIGGWVLAQSYTLPLDRQPPGFEFDPITDFERAVETPYGFYEDPLIVQNPPEEPEAVSVLSTWETALQNAQPVDQTPEMPPWQYSDEKLLNNLRDVWELSSRDPAWVGLAAVQNMRVLMVAALLGLISFGVLTVIIVALPFGILGYLFGNIFLTSINPVPFIMAVVPHGLVEIPAILIAGAVILRAGSIMTGDLGERTVGEVWLRGISDMIKIGLAVVFPLLLVAATLEVMVTPRVVEWALEIGF